jgi:glutamine synthetase adenylyltransferase
VSAEQKAREAQIAAEMERRKAQEEEARRLQQQQQAVAERQQPSQVELVLMERISTFLENSWGRSDLVSILTTLHAEDTRVIPLLGSVDALRALIARHPNRIGLRQDPAFGSEMAVLLLTNAQWAKQEQLARQEEQRCIELQRREEARRQAAAQKPQAAIISPDAPWFYSDPQNNVQVWCLLL